MDEVVTSEREAGRRFLVNSLMEEAIRSSRLEGATTSRVVAKELLRSGREPRDRHLYLQRKTAEQRGAEARLSGFDGLNGARSRS